eukprot:TRINITY_DN56870_c4_g1_i1.p2 TRINITY_DN56870_c4_g1~~TRINITY_DN56870_c4_g1_i1.p2  ORF type:complete len:112 (-),score=14.84 TRINITY_DN56870_c4_g1_i1:48-383(-)
MSDVSQDDKNLGMLTHLSGILLGFIVPLIIWLINKEKTDKDWLNAEAKEALNFQITVAIGYVICVALSVVVIGALMMPVLWIANLVFCIIAGLKAKDGVSYRYPFALRLIK